jgi:cold shock protein
MGENDVAIGSVKWFNATGGYGFIQPDSGGKDVFVHISAVEKAGSSGLSEGNKVSYEYHLGARQRVGRELTNRLTAFKRRRQGRA